MNNNNAMQEIIKRFDENVRGLKSDTTQSNKGHDGKEGHWLEKQMGIAHNANTEADLLGFEMKNQTNSKITFGDWSANYYLFKDAKYNLDRDNGFLPIFGKFNEEKGRYSWSGEPAPALGYFNRFGQKLILDTDNNILALYSYSADQRADKDTIIPPNLQQDELVIAQWNAEAMRKRVEKKFNNQGWFKCEKDASGIYCSIAFGYPISWEKWLEGFKQGDIFFDSGMYQGNKRPYSQWRANNNYWESLIYARY